MSFLEMSLAIPKEGFWFILVMDDDLGVEVEVTIALVSEKCYRVEGVDLLTLPDVAIQSPCPGFRVWKLHHRHSLDGLLCEQLLQFGHSSVHF